MDTRAYKRGRRKLITPIIVSLIVLLIAAAAGAYIAWKLDVVNTTSSPAPTSTEKPADPVPVAATSTSLFGGNAFWGRYINDWSMESDLGVAYPFSGLSEFDRDAYDAWFVGLECPVTAGDTMSSAQMDQTLSFNCSPDYLTEAAKWFTGFTLANNHTDNRGAEGFAETQAHLEERGIQYFGHYDPNDLENICDVIALPVTVTNDDKSTNDAALPVAMCGYNLVFGLPSEASLAVMEKYSEVMPVIAMPHMGVEYKTSPDALREQTYRAMIDHGADVVLGDHPHYVQTTESYKGHLIVYSMGNFLFDQQGNVEVTRSAAIRVRLDAKSSDDALASWLALGATCKTYHDDCLSEIMDKNVTPLDYTFEFSVVGTDDTNGITRPATAAQNEAILQRLGWSQTIQQLETPYSGV